MRNWIRSSFPWFEQPGALNRTSAVELMGSYAFPRVVFFVAVC
jgi:hypothetical protein